MDERKKMAFEFASDAAKQIITISTAVIGLTVTFLKDVLQAPLSYGWALRLAWLLYLLATVAGLWTLLSLTGSLGDSAIKEDNLSIYATNARVAMFVHVGAFIGAVVFTVVFGWQQL